MQDRPVDRVSARRSNARPRRAACSSRWKTRSSRTRRPPISKALEQAGEKDDDVVGYVFAVNGKLNSADVYPSNGLFRKMWPKLLQASVTEAIGEKNAGGDAGARQRSRAGLPR